MSPRWKQRDPLTDKTKQSGYPGPGYDQDLIVWPDWKPITGENAWVMMGGLQSAYAKYGTRVPIDSNDVKLAKSIVPALQALTTDIGAILHAPEGTYGKNPNDVSNENNISAYAALRMLHQVTGDGRYLDMMRGIEDYMKEYGLDKKVGRFLQGGSDKEKGVLYQGGLVDGKKFNPNLSDFAVDVQTWSIVAFTPKKIDEWYGEGSAYQMWAATKLRSGYERDGTLLGVGYTDGHDVLSVEWTVGAIAAALESALYYKDSHPDWAKEALLDAQSMTLGVETLSYRRGEGKGYLYADKRFYIPFGWWANPVGSTASTAWMFYLNQGFNPFVLGGKTRWQELKDFRETLDKINRGKISTPKPDDKEPADPGPKKESGGEKVVVLAYGIDGTWGDGRAFSGWKDGSFNLKTAKSIRLTFPTSQAGVKFLVRLLPKGNSPESQAGLNRKAYTVPQDGIVTIPLSEFPINGGVLESIIQISIHSGTNAWGIPLNNDGNKNAIFQKVETVSDQAMLGTKGGIDLNPNMVDMNVEKEGTGVQMPVMQIPAGLHKIEGFVPVIMNVVPIPNYRLPFILGLGNEEEKQPVAESGPQDRYSLKAVENDYLARF